MPATNMQLTILSEAEQAALYESSDFDDDQRLLYLNLTSEEQALARGRSNLSIRVYCAIQIGYFKAKHMFFRFDWDEVQEDIDFVMQQYFPGEPCNLAPLTKHQHYDQCHAIAAHFGYRQWSKELDPLLYEQVHQILRRDISPQFIVIELLGFLKEKKIIRPKYTTLQTIISGALTAERNRLAVILRESLTEQDKSYLQELLSKEKSETLSDLADLKQDAKDFKPRMMAAERENCI